MKYFWKLSVVTLTMVSAAMASAVTEKKVVLPQRLSGPKNGLRHVCATAKAQGKSFALVLRKSHACDNALEEQHRQCMQLTQAASDGCNPQLRDKFAIFHIRMGRYPGGNSGEYQELVDQQQAWKVWDEVVTKEGFPVEPGLLLVDVAKCRLVRHIFLYDVDFRNGRFNRIRALNDALARESLLAESPLKTDDVLLKGCFATQGEPTHPELWKEMDAQARP